MSTILDALRKLQRERAAESPSRDLRGSLTTETPRKVVRRRRGSSSLWVLALLLIAIAGGGYWAYSSGQVDALRARLGGASADPDEAQRLAAIAELEAYERQLEARQEASQAATAAEPEPVPDSAPQVAAPPVEPVPSAEPPTLRADSPEILVERARLEAALANARAAQETQRQAEQAAAAAAAAAATPPTTTLEPEPEIVLVKPPEKPVAVAAKPLATKPKPKPAAKPARAQTANETKPAPASRVEAESDDAYAQSSFPEVRVESIRWHPNPERRVASLRFERQNVPQAREGDIVAGVLVYRIDPGAVELRIGTSHRVVTPAP